MNAVDVFTAGLQAAVADGTFRKLTLGKLKGDLAPREHVYVRSVDLRGAPHLSFLHRFPDRDETENLGLAPGLAQVRAWLGGPCLAATLFTASERQQLLFNRRGKPRLARQAETTEPAPRQHDAPKARTLRDESFLLRLGVLDASGKPKPQMGDKYRQVHHFVDLTASVVREMGRGGSIRVVDLGSGKGYLTFALYAFLTESGFTVEMVGIEQRPALVALCNEVAAACGYGGLRFQTGRIKEADLQGVDVVVALHACDTATDDALLKAIEAGAHWILAAPCCHKEVRPQLQAPKGLEPLFRFGIEVDRLAEAVTDTLRTLCLEAAGYHARLQEFIDLEHTHKNVLIMATKNLKTFDRAAKWAEARDFQQRFGITRQTLSASLAGKFD